MQMNSAEFLDFSTKLFRSYDKDKSGYIDRSELLGLLIKLSQEWHCQTPSDYELNKVYAYLDTNQDGRISFDEFVTLSEVIVKKADKK
ncbi:hypothetical protein pb186bvf_014649 [Paramecium bursaria]